MTPEETDRGAKATEISRKAERREAAEKRRDGRTVWFGLGMFGLVGWAVAVPTLIGIVIGAWLDRTVAKDGSWTLALLLGGVALGCLNAWWWVSRESRNDD